MADSTTTSVSWDNALLREQARQKRKRKGWQQTDLSDRFDEEVLHEHPKRHLVETTEPVPLFPEFEVMVQQLLEGETPPQPVEAKHCPFHQVLLDYKITPTHWQYYRCPIKACPMFCGADRVDDWLAKLPAQLNPCYKEQPRLPFVCFCKHERYRDLKLNQSHSPNNPNRFYLSCKHRDFQNNTGCRFFQWLDLPFLSSNAPAWQSPTC